jgi:four helix bundle protein
VRTAIGSSLELETQLEAAVRLKFVSRERARKLAETIDRVQKLLYGMRRDKLRRIGAVTGATVVILSVAHLF